MDGGALPHQGGPNFSPSRPRLAPGWPVTTTGCAGNESGRWRHSGGESAELAKVLASWEGEEGGGKAACRGMAGSQRKAVRGQGRARAERVCTAGAGLAEATPGAAVPTGGIPSQIGWGPRDHRGRERRRHDRYSRDGLGAASGWSTSRPREAKRVRGARGMVWPRELPRPS
ncbi:hypothetical protein E2562_011763 [Oryza meyeriana var. granulata]|uniref:Uncharacterized protein n=1 Tax=Oryza meyeriana var. granulata TaxID=110450 RepID=A0A6G1CQ31_9ORYZ|nr:hypothetical protein E2562_011763 [Oryza meyeriana var. granulata]